jgi:hypothetical protein
MGAEPGCGSAEFTLAEIVISPLASGNTFTNSIAYSLSSDLRTLQETRPAAGRTRSAAPQQALSADFRRRHGKARRIV